MLPSFCSLLLFAAHLFLVTAIPSVPSIPSELYQPPSLPSVAATQRSPTARSSFNWLRDSLIKQIWGPPQRHEHHASCDHARPKFSAPSNFRSRYNDDVVLRFKIKTEEEAKALAEVSEILYLDVWESTEEWVDIRMAKDMVSSVLGLLPPPMKISYTPLMHDLAQTIFDSYPSDASNFDRPAHRGFTSTLHDPTSASGESRELFFQEYQPLSVIVPWMRLMASLFPSHVSLFSIGTSYEGRDIPALRIGVHPTNNDQPLPPRKTILISGGSHAREWISTTTVNYVAYSLITRYGRFPAITKMLEEFDFIFVPTLNPDGYVYTWDTDRLWRKNRQETDLRFCHGIDLDRAWGFAWDGVAARSNPCSESYAGGEPFEGVEARRLADWARNETLYNNVTFLTFVDLHSYSQQILYPYSYSCASAPPSLENLQEVAMDLAKAFRLTNGHYYGVSSACESSVVASDKQDKVMRPKMDLGGGSALDWFYHELGVKYTYQVKLRDTGSYGFLLPKVHIVPTGQETFNAIIALGRYLLGNNGVELNWENEFISIPETTRHPEEEVASTEEANSTDARDDDDEREEELEDDWTAELRRRRRR